MFRLLLVQAIAAAAVIEVTKRFISAAKRCGSSQCIACPASAYSASRALRINPNNACCSAAERVAPDPRRYLQALGDEAIEHRRGDRLRERAALKVARELRLLVSVNAG
jgi:hypothetical protein